MKLNFCFLFLTFLAGASIARQSADIPGVKLSAVAPGWANNSVNTAIFRKNSLVSFKDSQFIAWYDQEGWVMLGKRRISETKWTVVRTAYKGNTADAHNVICIMVDGDGYLHIAWDHHNNELRYARSVAPGSLELTGKLPMTGTGERSVSYPEFYRMPGGNLLFVYRNGTSGSGDMVMNSYDLRTMKWARVQDNLIGGEGTRNAYWQLFTDVRGTLHVSWVWRETPDVASNHDLCYARSPDGGRTWEKSSGEKYQLPITAANAEVVCAIPQKSELINQTSMAADSRGRPYIATYWREKDSDVPQYHLVYYNGKNWLVSNLNTRKTPFSLSGAGTKRIPVSRPQLIARAKGDKTTVSLIFRDAERGDRVSLATCTDLNAGSWSVKDLTTFPVGSWEPSFDTELWKDKGRLDLFVQRTEQIDGEGKADIPPQQVQVLEVKF